MLSLQQQQRCRFLEYMAPPALDFDGMLIFADLEASYGDGPEKAARQPRALLNIAALCGDSSIDIVVEPPPVCSARSAAAVRALAAHTRAPALPEHRALRVFVSWLHCHVARRRGRVLLVTHGAFNSDCALLRARLDAHDVRVPSDVSRRLRWVDSHRWVCELQAQGLLQLRGPRLGMEALRQHYAAVYPRCAPLQQPPQHTALADARLLRLLLAAVAASARLHAAEVLRGLAAAGRRHFLGGSPVPHADLAALPEYLRALPRLALLERAPSSTDSNTDSSTPPAKASTATEASDAAARQQLFATPLTALRGIREPRKARLLRLCARSGVRDASGTLGDVARLRPEALEALKNAHDGMPPMQPELWRLLHAVAAAQAARPQRWQPLLRRVSEQLR